MKVDELWESLASVALKDEQRRLMEDSMGHASKGSLWETHKISSEAPIEVVDWFQFRGTKVVYYKSYVAIDAPIKALDIEQFLARFKPKKIMESYWEATSLCFLRSNFTIHNTKMTVEEAVQYTRSTGIGLNLVPNTETERVSK